jgi:hypothetical protein
MQNQFDYKVVVILEFLDGTEEYVVWEPLLYADMVKNNVDFIKLFYMSPEVIRTPPLNVDLFLYLNPSVKEIVHSVNEEQVKRQILVGHKLFHIRSY